MRIKLNNPKTFFNELKKEKSLRKFSKEINIAYSTIKRWYRGENTIDQRVYDSLIKRSPDKAQWNNEITLLDDTWGQSLAGKISAIKLGKIGIKNKLQKARAKKRLDNYRKFNPRLSKKFCEFYGALIGDGCITVYKKWDGYTAYDIVIVGHKTRDRAYHFYLKKIIEDEIKIYAKIVEIKKLNVRRIIIKSKGLIEFLNNLGFPTGKKGKKLSIPKKIIELEWYIKKNLVRGIFDTDGSILAKKHEKYRYPYIIITSISDKLLLQLHKILKKRGYPFYIRKATDTHAGEILMRGNKNVIRWMKDIGSNNQKHTIKYEYWLRNRFLPAKLLNQMGL